MSKIVDVLKEIKIFSSLNSGEFDSLSKLINIINLEKDKDIFKEGDTGDCLYILVKGKVNISKSLTMMTGKSDKKSMEKSFLKLTDRVKPFFGEIAMLDENSTRTATIKALEDCIIYELKKEEFENLCQEDPKIGYKVYYEIAKVVSQNLKKADNDILKLTTALSLALSK